MARFTQEQWRALISEQAASEQTATAFCVARGIDYKYFSTKKSQLSKPSTTNAFVAVTAKHIENQHIHLCIGGTQLRIPAGVSAQWLADFIKALA